MEPTVPASSSGTPQPLQRLPTSSQLNLNELCEPEKCASHQEEPKDPEKRLGIVAGFLLGLEGRIRRATTAATDTLGVYTLPALFIGGGLLGAAAATISFKSRMRALRAVSPPAAAGPASAAAARCSPSHTAAVRAAANSPAAAAAAASPAATSASPNRERQAASVIAAELSRHRKQKPWEAGEDDEEELGPQALGGPRGPPTARELFTAKELATLFLLPAATILSVFAGVWLFLKWQCGIADVS